MPTALLLSWPGRYFLRRKPNINLKLLHCRRRSQQFSESEEYLDTESESIYARYVSNFDIRQCYFSLSRSVYASKTSFGSPDEGSPSPGPESLYGSRQGLQVEEAGGHQLVEQQMLEEDENVDEVLDQEEEQEQEQEPGEGEYLTMASILTVVPSLAKNETKEEAKKEEDDVEDDGGEECGKMEDDDGGNLEDKEVEEINSVNQQKKEVDNTR